MEKNRLEAFSNGVFAIIITIIVLEMKAPHSIQLADLKPLLLVFLSYVLSFIYLGIYWNNYHHMLYTTKHVSGGLLWLIPDRRIERILSERDKEKIFSH